MMKKIRALIVDDDTVNQAIHRRLLQSSGIEITAIARNGREAVDLHRSGNSFDLILMDLDMPIMNGIDATRKLRAMGIESTIAGASSRCIDEKEVKEFVKAGLDDYQQKPLTLAKFGFILQKLKHNG